MTRLRQLMPRFNIDSAALRIIAFGVVALVMAAGVRAEAGNPTGSKTVSFNRDIRPILADKCFKCHGPDARQRKGKLRLDNATRRDGAGRVGERGDRAGQARRERALPADHRRRIPTSGCRRPRAARRSRPPRSPSSRPGSRRGPSIKGTGRSRRRSGPPLPPVKNRGLVPQPDRPLHPGQAGGRGAQAVARGRQGHA